MLELDRLRAAIDVWARPPTPYAAGQCRPGVGVDCLRFVDDVLCRWRGVELEELPRHAQDAAFHDARVVVEMIDLMTSRHGFVRVGGTPFPGDVLTIAYEANESHIAIVGPCGVRVWHAAHPRVCATSLAGLVGTHPGAGRLRRVYRSIRFVHAQPKPHYLVQPVDSRRGRSDAGG